MNWQARSGQSGRADLGSATISAVDFCPCHRFGHHYPGLKIDLLHPAYRSEDGALGDGLAYLCGILARS